MLIKIITTVTNNIQTKKINNINLLAWINKYLPRCLDVDEGYLTVSDSVVVHKLEVGLSEVLLEKVSRDSCEGALVSTGVGVVPAWLMEIIVLQYVDFFTDVEKECYGFPSSDFVSKTVVRSKYFLEILLHGFRGAFIYKVRLKCHVWYFEAPLFIIIDLVLVLVC